ncbi:S4 domain-containing protein [Citroniella saccharovorans]|uniref:RQC P-site tRNA stabilizing factor n=1 Tax=Citroniella saccharovorans TaxID=2053367 RepID=A0AAW9MX17_9FIRM|nr:S4 domain-containing protein [Citroniella saccharovorans]MEB3429052.1 S4 domain-containing protein [Citroniella saccharovorans]
MRVDIFLKNSRIIKRRTVAKLACEGGRVKINEKTAKPGDDVKIGDIISVVFGEKEYKYKVKKILETQSKSNMEEMVEVI